MKPPLSAKKKAAKPLTLDQAAAELADLGISRDMVKAFAVGGRIELYRLGAKRLVQRHALEAFRVWAEEKIAEDPDWLEAQAQRMRGRQGNVRRVVSGVSAPLPRVVALSTTAVGPPRQVLKAPTNKPAKVVSIHDAPHPTPPRVVEKGHR